jgi:hypothetical protein
MGWANKELGLVNSMDCKGADWQETVVQTFNSLFGGPTLESSENLSSYLF